MRKGFTLVELSIVLVIVGLLIGGVLKGKGMIESTKVKRVKSDIDSIVAATYTYQDRFNALPGDDNVARTVSPSITTVAGNGNGAIGDAVEALQAWRAFIGLGVVSGDAGAATEALIAKKSPFGNIYTLRTDATGHNIQSGNIPNNMIQQLDEKYDDGVQTTGDIRSNTAYGTTAYSTITWYAF